jgi:hypothetical protein
MEIHGDYTCTDYESLVDRGLRRAVDLWLGER